MAIASACSSLCLIRAINSLSLSEILSFISSVSERRLDRAEKFPLAPRFRNDELASPAPPPDFLIRCRSCREDEFQSGADLSAQFEQLAAIHGGHKQIGDEEVDFLIRLDHLQRPVRIRCRDQLVGVRPQNLKNCLDYR